MKRIRNKVSLTASELAEKVGARLEGNGDIIITDVSPIDQAQTGDISFVSNQSYIKHIKTTKASALILDDNTSAENCRSVLRHKNPYLTFAKVIDILYPRKQLVPTGLDKSSVVGENCQIDKSSGIGPLCHIKDNSKIGKNSQLVSSVFVGKNVSIGENCIIYPNVTILDDSQIGDNVIIHASTVIGSDGFGYAESERGLKKIQQIGYVKIEDNVEIGSNVSIDRGTLGATKIGANTKIDNLVHIAHNVQIGEHSIILGQVGIAGSATIGKQVILAGQAGVAGHVTIGDKAIVGGQSGITKSIKGDNKYFGTPAKDFMTTAKINASINKLPDLLKRVKELEKKLK